jgi:beta-lactamase class A
MKAMALSAVSTLASISRRGFVRTLSAGLVAGGATLRSSADEAFLGRLEEAVAPVGGELGFALHHLGTGERLSLRGSERFAMASVYKLPICLAVLDAVDRGEFSLLKTVRLLPKDLRMGLGTDALEKLIGTEGYEFTVRQLIEKTLEESENTTSDALLALIGASAVTARMVALGVPEIRVDRPEVALLLDFVGVSSDEPAAGWTMVEIRARYQSASPAQRQTAMVNFLDDPRDTATPDAMVNLLGKVHRGEALSAASTKRLLGHMTACKTGNGRLRGQLPPELPFAHRTGTTDTTDGTTAGTNDVGILTLPEKKGTVLLAAFLRKARGSMAEREAALARVGKLVLDRYMGA